MRYFKKASLAENPASWWDEYQVFSDTSLTFDWSDSFSDVYYNTNSRSRSEDGFQDFAGDGKNEFSYARLGRGNAEQLTLACLFDDGGY